MKREQMKSIICSPFIYWTENLKGLFYFSKIDVKLFIQVYLDGIIESIRNI